MIITADEARKIASEYEPPKDTIDTVLPIIMEKIVKAASSGASHLRLICIPLVPEVKKELKKLGFEVVAYREFDIETNKKIFNGDMEVSWE